MIHCENFDKVAAKYDEYWHRENHDRPLICIRTPVGRPTAAPSCPNTLRERWLDTEYRVRAARHAVENTLCFGEAYPIAWPNLGPDIFGAFLGCDLEFGEGTSWATGQVNDLRELKLDRLDSDNFWWRKTLEMTQAFCEDARGDYLVGVTDIHTGMDALVSLRGPEAVCVDMIEEDDLIEKMLPLLFDRFRDTYTALHNLIGKYQTGETNWLGVYHAEGWYVTSCDLQGMISETMMKRFVLPGLQSELKLLGHSIFHLDGIGALRHLDTLLAQDNLQGIQWVPGAGKPGAPYWIDVLRRIQSAGKTVHISVAPNELPVLLEALPPEGMLYDIYCARAEDAEALMKLAEKREKKLF